MLKRGMGASALSDALKRLGYHRMRPTGIVDECAVRTSCSAPSFTRISPSLRRLRGEAILEEMHIWEEMHMWESRGEKAMDAQQDGKFSRSEKE